jgi:hypothetical protein
VDWRVIAAAFSAIFLAEMGDKTQLAAMTMAASSGHPLSVFVGAAVALTAVSAIGVMVGGASAPTYQWVDQARGRNSRSWPWRPMLPVALVDGAREHHRHRARTAVGRSHCPTLLVGAICALNFWFNLGGTTLWDLTRAVTRRSRADAGDRSWLAPR